MAQGSVAGDIGPQGERTGLALVEFGKGDEVGLGALLIGAERVPSSMSSTRSTSG
ncbi:hypothetical protein ACR6C2_03960 [Streptomyces sp. INA 01156]